MAVPSVSLPGVQIWHATDSPHKPIDSWRIPRSGPLLKLLHNPLTGSCDSVVTICRSDSDICQLALDRKQEVATNWLAALVFC